MFSFARLIEFYKTDMPNDDKDVMKFMKESDAKTILSNGKLWGEDLSYLAPERLKSIFKAEKCDDYK